MEQRKIEKEKKRKEEEEKEKELNKMKQKAIEILLYRRDRKIKMILKQKFDIYYLKAKVISLNDYKKPRRVKTVKKKDRKRNSAILNFENTLNTFNDKNIEFKRSNSDEKNKDNQYKEFENNIIFEEEKE